MKKYVVGLLFLLVAQNAHAMEEDLLAMVLKNEEKCKLVAKYVYNYPAGRNKEEAVKIERFLKDTTSIRVVLSRGVNKYRNRLKNMEAEAILYDMHATNLPSEVKQQIFTYVLWDYAAQYYVLYNTGKFVAMDSQLIPHRCYSYPRDYYMPCFLAEIYEDNDQHIFFSKKALDHLADKHEISKQRIRFFDFYKNRFYSDCGQKSKLFCCIKNIRWGGLLSVPIECTQKRLRDLVFFLDIKKLRAIAFKQEFNESIESLAKIDGTEGIDNFIELLTLYKNLPKTAAFMYESEMHRPASELLQDVLKHFS